MLRERLAGQVPSSCLRRCALRLLGDQMMPEEVLDGDLAVTVRSACLEAAARAVETALDHQALKTDETVLAEVIRVVADGEMR